jgi:hypothetical protein
MKGIVFTEFIDLVEEKFGFEVADQIIERSALPSGGAYTAIGSYDQKELVQLVTQLHQVTGLALAELLQMFGRHLFGRFVGRYPEVFEAAADCFSFLAHLDGHIHGTLNQLYPDAELPQFEFRQRSTGEVELSYRSNNQLGDLAEGLIQGCAAHFQESLHVRREESQEAAETRVRFYLMHQAWGSDVPL